MSHTHMGMLEILPGFVAVAARCLLYSATLQMLSTLNALANHQQSPAMQVHINTDIEPWGDVW